MHYGVAKYLIASADGLERREGEAHLSPEGAHDELLAADLLHAADEFLILPGVHARALNDLLLGEDVQQLGPDVAGEAKGLHRPDRSAALVLTCGM
jgi:hypothetical protein